MGDVAACRSDPTFTRASPGLAVAEQLPQSIIISILILILIIIIIVITIIMLHLKDIDLCSKTLGKNNDFERWGMWEPAPG